MCTGLRRRSLPGAIDQREEAVNTYVILRRSAWASGEDLEQAAGRSAKVGDEEMSDEVRWIRSYVLEEPDGRLGTVCVYEAPTRSATTPAGPTSRSTRSSRSLTRSWCAPTRRPRPRSAALVEDRRVTASA
jgi:hypothetical protein